METTSWNGQNAGRGQTESCSYSFYPEASKLISDRLANHLAPIFQRLGAIFFSDESNTTIGKAVQGHRA